MIGLTSVTFRKLSCKEIIRLAQESGAQCIEWGGDVHVTDLETARAAREGCAQAGIQARSYGSYYRLGGGEAGQFQRLCEITRELGAQVLRVWLGAQGSAKTTDAELAALVEEGRKITEIAAEYGVTVASEFHRNTFNDTAESCLRFLELCGGENLKTYWQPMYGGRDLVNLNAVLAQTQVVHLFYWNQSGSRRYPLRKGETIVRAFLEELREQKYQGDILLEFVKRDSLKQYREDLLFLQRLWEELP